MVRQEYTPGMTIFHTPTALDGRFQAIRIQGFGADTPLTLVNTYQLVNSPCNIAASCYLLETVYHCARKTHGKEHLMVWSGDQNAVLDPTQRSHYADLGTLSQGDDLLQSMVLKMGATDTTGGSDHTWRAKTGPQSATLDHILVFPPDLRVTGGGIKWMQDV